MSLFGKLFGKRGSRENRDSDVGEDAGAAGIVPRTGLENPACIDLISSSPDGKSILLHLVAGEPWDPEGKRAMQLQAKLKSYVAFAADGQLARDHPVSRGKRVVISIDTQHSLGALEQRVVDAVREQWCRSSGIELMVQAL
jgi:hypothetical protein